MFDATEERITKSNANLITDPNLEEEICHRAYTLYEKRGREDRDDRDDWHRAEGELTVALKTAA